MNKSTFQKLLSATRQQRHPLELALGFLRYEALRKLGPRQYTELCRKNIREGKRFDDLVDELITK